MRITRVFLGSDLRCSFDGLRALAVKAKTKINEDSSVLFINTARTKFKMLRANTYLVYYSNGNRRIPLEAIGHLPQAFGGTEAEMDDAIRKSIAEKIGVEVK